MKIGFPTEVFEGETRVAVTPESTSKLAKLGHEVLVQAGAGNRAGYSDKQYLDAGAKIASEADVVWLFTSALVRQSLDGL